MIKKKYGIKLGKIILSAVFIMLSAVSFEGCFKTTIEKESTNSENEDIIKEYKELDNFNKINVDVNTGIVEVLKGEKYAIEINYDNTKDNLDYKVSGKELIVTGKSNNKSFTFLDFDTHKSPEIKIYLPDNKIDEVNMDMDSGDSKIESVSANNLKVDCGSGDIKIKNAEYKKIDVKASSGDFDADNINCDEMKIKSSSGNISCNSLKTNMININASSANVDLDGELKGDNTIKTSSGSINIKTSVNQKYYSYDVSCASGRIKVDGSNMKNNYKETNIGAENSFNVECSSGDISIKF